MEEFELTYLPKKEIREKLTGLVFKEMIDIYIPKNSPHPTLRIRKSGSKYEVTKKQPVREGDSSHQLETTILLTQEEFNELNHLEGKRVHKNRYLHKEGPYAFEIDEFTGDLAGLILVDIEFSSNEEKAKFTPPEWILADVTQENFIAGGMLCGKKYSDIEEKLRGFGYEKI